MLYRSIVSQDLCPVCYISFQKGMFSMKRITARVFSLGMSALIALLCIPGCGSSDNSGAKDTSAPSGTPADSTDPETTSLPPIPDVKPVLVSEELSDFEYCAVDEDCIAVTGYRGEGGYVEIPPTIDGMTVTIIAGMEQLVEGVDNGSGYVSTPDQKETKPITGIKIPDTVKYIDEGAFIYCQDIETIDFPEGLIQIGSKAFHETKWYESQPDGNVYLGNVYYTYKGDNYRNPGISIKDGTKVIAEDALSYGGWPPDEYTYIEGKPVKNDNYEEELKEYEAARNALSGVTIPDSVEWIGSGAFSGRITDSLVIPESVTRVGYGIGLDYDDNGYTGKIYSSYGGNDSGTSEPAPLTIRGGTRCIEELALCDIYGEFRSTFRSVSTITLPDSLCDIGLRDPGYETKGLYGWGFDYLPNLTEIKVGENNQYYCAVDGVLFNKDKTELIAFPQSKPADGYKIPDTVKKIGGNAFSGREDLTSIVIPDSVTCIGNYAFEGTGLTSITIPDSVRYIGKGSLKNCKSLTEVKLGSSVTVIGAGAFDGCENLTGTITIPDSTFMIEKRAFADCSKIITLNMGSHVKFIGSEAFLNCKGFSDLTLPDTLREIGEGAFKGCTGPSKIVIPKGITIIRKEAFYGCTGITRLELPEGLLYVDREAFRNISVRDLVLPYGMKGLGSSAFVYDRGDSDEDETPQHTSRVGEEPESSAGEKAYKNFSSITFPETITIGNIDATNADLIFVGTQQSYNELPERTKDAFSKARSVRFQNP